MSQRSKSASKKMAPDGFIKSFIHAERSNLIFTLFLFCSVYCFAWFIRNVELFNLRHSQKGFIDPNEFIFKCTHVGRDGQVHPLACKEAIKNTIQKMQRIMNMVGCYHDLDAFESIAVLEMLTDRLSFCTDYECVANFDRKYGFIFRLVVFKANTFYLVDEHTEECAINEKYHEFKNVMEWEKLWAHNS